MYRSFCKRYQKELHILVADADELKDQQVLTIFAKNLSKIQQNGAHDWKFACHLLQAFQSFATSILQKRVDGGLDKSTVYQCCLDSLYKPVLLSLKSKLSEAQLGGVVKPLVDSIISLVFNYRNSWDENAVMTELMPSMKTFIRTSGSIDLAGISFNASLRCIRLAAQQISSISNESIQRSSGSTIQFAVKWFKYSILPIAQEVNVSETDYIKMILYVHEMSSMIVGCAAYSAFAGEQEQDHFKDELSVLMQELIPITHKFQSLFPQSAYVAMVTLIYDGNETQCPAVDILDAMGSIHDSLLLSSSSSSSSSSSPPQLLLSVVEGELLVSIPHMLYHRYGLCLGSKQSSPDLGVELVAKLLLRAQDIVADNYDEKEQFPSAASHNNRNNSKPNSTTIIIWKHTLRNLLCSGSSTAKLLKVMSAHKNTIGDGTSSGRSDTYSLAQKKRRLLQLKSALAYIEGLTACLARQNELWALNLHGCASVAKVLGSLLSTAIGLLQVEQQQRDGLSVPKSPRVKAPDATAAADSQLIWDECGGIFETFLLNFSALLAEVHVSTAPALGGAASHEHVQSSTAGACNQTQLITCDILTTLGQITLMVVSRMHKAVKGYREGSVTLLASAVCNSYAVLRHYENMRHVVLSEDKENMRHQHQDKESPSLLSSSYKKLSSLHGEMLETLSHIILFVALQKYGCMNGRDASAEPCTNDGACVPGAVAAAKIKEINSHPVVSQALPVALLHCAAVQRFCPPLSAQFKACLLTRIATSALPMHVAYGVLGSEALLHYFFPPLSSSLENFREPTIAEPAATKSMHREISELYALSVAYMDSSAGMVRGSISSDKRHSNNSNEPGSITIQESQCDVISKLGAIIESLDTANNKSIHSSHPGTTVTSSRNRQSSKKCCPAERKKGNSASSAAVAVGVAAEEENEEGWTGSFVDLLKESERALCCFRVWLLLSTWSRHVDGIETDQAVLTDCARFGSAYLNSTINSLKLVAHYMLQLTKFKPIPQCGDVGFNCQHDGDASNNDSNSSVDDNSTQLHQFVFQMQAWLMIDIPHYAALLSLTGRVEDEVDMMDCVHNLLYSIPGEFANTDGTTSVISCAHSGHRGVFVNIWHNLCISAVIKLSVTGVSSSLDTALLHCSLKATNSLLCDDFKSHERENKRSNSGGGKLRGASSIYVYALMCLIQLQCVDDAAREDFVTRHKLQPFMALVRSDDHHEKNVVGVTDAFQTPESFDSYTKHVIGIALHVAQSSRSKSAPMDTQNHAWKLASSTGSGTGNHSEGVLWVSSSFPAWVAIMCSKIMLLVYCDVRKSAAWARIAYSHTISSPESDDRHLNLQSTNARIEALLLLADVHEHCGNLDGSVAYLGEAISISNSLRSIACQNVISLHAVRIWHRAGSPRLRTVVDELLDAGGEYALSQIELQRNDVGNRVRSVVSFLAVRFKWNVDDDEEEKEDKDDKQTVEADIGGFSMLSYRYMYKYWDLQICQPRRTVTSDLPSTNQALKSQQQYHTAGLSLSAKSFLHRNLKDSTSQTPTLSSISAFSTRQHNRPSDRGDDDGDDGDVDGSRELLLGSNLQVEQEPRFPVASCASGTLAFDAIRAVRRSTCLRLLQRSNRGLEGDHDGHTVALGAFIAGAASCGVAAECCSRLESKGPDVSEDRVGEHGTDRGSRSHLFASLFGAANGINRAILGSRHCTRQIDDALHLLLKHLQFLSRRPRGVNISTQAQRPSEEKSDGAPSLSISTMTSSRTGVRDESNSRSDTSISDSAVCFLCVDRQSGNLLIGRYSLPATAIPAPDAGSASTNNTTNWTPSALPMDASTASTATTCMGAPLVVSLPTVADQLASLLQAWDDLQDRNKQILRQGLDPANVSKLSEAQKKSWWTARQKYDEGIESFLSDFQDLLGPWRVLLSPLAPTALDRATQELSSRCRIVLEQHLQQHLQTQTQQDCTASTSDSVEPVEQQQTQSKKKSRSIAASARTTRPNASSDNNDNNIKATRTSNATRISSSSSSNSAPLVDAMLPWIILILTHLHPGVGQEESLTSAAGTSMLIRGSSGSGSGSGSSVVVPAAATAAAATAGSVSARSMLLSRAHAVEALSVILSEAGIIIMQQQPSTHDDDHDMHRRHLDSTLLEELLACTGRYRACSNSNSNSTASGQERASAESMPPFSPLPSDGSREFHNRSMSNLSAGSLCIPPSEASHSAQIAQSPPPPSLQYTEVELNTFKVMELRRILKENDLEVSGRKAELVHRLLEHYAVAQQSTPSHHSRSISLDTPATLSDTTAGHPSSMRTHVDSVLGNPGNSDDHSSGTRDDSSPPQPRNSRSHDEGQAEQRTSGLGGGGGGGGGGGHVVLILDEQLQRIPIECMPALRTASCSRVPGLAVLLKIIHQQTSQQYSEAHHHGQKTTVKSSRNHSHQDKGEEEDFEIDKLASEMKDVLALKSVGGNDENVCLSNEQSTEKQPKKKKLTSNHPKSKQSSRVAMNNAQVSRSVHDDSTLMSAGSIRNRYSSDCWRQIDVHNGWYALDVEGNLPGTRTALQPFLNQYAEQWQWEGVVAQIPSDKTTRSLHESRHLFIYCGHGAGESMYDTFKMRKFASCPAAYLWGCSSGKLRAQGVHDPLGPALYYLMAGAPYVLANLWDVTDKDIDKLCMTCMGKLLPDTRITASSRTPSSNQQQSAGGLGKERSSSKEKNGQKYASFTGNASTSLSASRDVCRMQHAVGSAPVVYGIPTEFL